MATRSWCGCSSVDTSPADPAVRSSSDRAGRRGGTLAGAIAFVPFLGRTFLPEFNEGALTVGVAACLALLVSFKPHVYAAGGGALALAALVVATRRWWKR